MGLVAAQRLAGRIGSGGGATEILAYLSDMFGVQAAAAARKPVMAGRRWGTTAAPSLAGTVRVSPLGVGVGGDAGGIGP